ncbi:MAG: acyl carrier protein [Clostridia bacterium]|nr:acyl carrier protein [Clostridia bacterium]
MNQEIMDRLNAIFQDVFDDDSLTVGPNTTAKDVEDWDSLSHITLVSAVEDEFRMKFSMKEVVEMKNVGEMISIIEARRKR